MNKLIYWDCGIMLAASLVGCDKPASNPPTETSSAATASTTSTSASTTTPSPPNKRQYPLEAPSLSKTIEVGVSDGKKIVLKRHITTLNSTETITGIRQLLQLGFKPPTLASFDAALAKGQLVDPAQLQAYLTSVIEELDRHCLLFRFLEVVDPSQPLPANTKLIKDPIKDYFSVSYTSPEDYVQEYVDMVK